jgi:hypothetical protein
MSKVDFTKKMEQLRKRIESSPRSNYHDSTFEPIPRATDTPRSVSATPEKERKFCPLTGEPCTSKCKWFRFNKSGHNCPVPEILAVSWHLNEIKEFLFELVGAEQGSPEQKESSKEKIITEY